MTNDSPPVKATATTFRVVHALLDSGTMGVSDLAAQLEMSKSSVHSHLTTLEQLGYVVRDSSGSRLSLRLFQTGSRLRDQHELYSIGRLEVDQLVTMSEFTAGIAVEECGRALCLYHRTNQDNSSAVFSEGQTMPLHATASGKAILAAMDADERTTLIDAHEFESYTESTHTTRESLEEELQQIGNRGVAFERGEYFADVSAVAAAVTDTDGSVLGSIYIAGQSETLSGKQLLQNSPGLIVSAKNRLSNTAQSPSK